LLFEGNRKEAVSTAQIKSTHFMSYTTDSYCWQWKSASD